MTLTRPGDCTRSLALAAGLLLAAGLVGAGCGPSTPRTLPRTAPSIILVTLDTTRADHLGCYGYARETTPHLDRLAAEAVVYTRAYATSSWTLPSHASLLTGRFPTGHGARYDPEGPLVLTDAIEGPEGWQVYRARGLGADAVTLAEVLREHGFATGAVVAGPWMKRVFGLGRGFDFYDDSGIDELNGKLAPEVTQSALQWVAEQEPGRPLFLFLNYFDPHSPLRPPREFSRPFLEGPVTAANAGSPAVMNALYDGEIRFADHHLGALFEKLREVGIYQRSWVVVTGDHGELFGENGRLGHGYSLYEPEIRIPMIVKPPKGEPAARRDPTPVQLTDVLPTILQRLELPVPPGVQGSPFERVTHPIIAEVYPLQTVSAGGDWQAIVEDSFKYLSNSAGNDALYDLSRDPLEAVDVSAEHPERARRMKETLAAFLDSLPRPAAAGPDQVVDEETRRALQGLGYTEGRPPPAKSGDPDR